MVENEVDRKKMNSSIVAHSPEKYVYLIIIIPGAAGNDVIFPKLKMTLLSGIAIKN